MLIFTGLIALAVLMIVAGSIKVYRRGVPRFAVIYLGFVVLLAAACVHAYLEWSEGATAYYDPRGR